MSRVLLVLALALGGCPHEELRREVKAEPPPPPPPPPAPPKPDPLPAWRAGWTNAQPILKKPSESWAIVLGGPVTAPLLADDTQVYAVADGTVSAFTLDGHEVWHTAIPGVSGAALAGDAVVAGGSDGRLHFLDRATGRDRSVTERGGAIVGAPVPVDGGWAWVTADGVVVTTAGWLQSFGHHPAGRPAADGSTVYVATVDGFVLAVGPQGVVWQAELPAGAVAGPSLSEDGVFVSYASKSGEPGGVVVFERGGDNRGKERWRFPTLFQPLAAPAVEASVYLPDKDGSLYALDPATGEKRWVNEGYGSYTTEPVVTRGSIFVGNSDGNLVRIDTFDGGTAWQVGLGAPVAAEPVIVGSRIVVGLANGRVVALE